MSKLIVTTPAGFSRDATVGAVVAAFPAAGSVFVRHGIDFCCGGKKTLGDAATDCGLSFEELQANLAASVGPSTPEERSFAETPLCELVAHIVDRYHDTLRYELPRQETLLARVRLVHGARHGELLEELAVTHALLCEELYPHMEREESVLFPYIVALEEARAAGRAAPYAPFGPIERPLLRMERDHEGVGKLLGRLRTLTDHFRPPEGTCQAFRTLYEELATLEQELHAHIHLENNVLHQRARALELAGPSFAVEGTLVTAAPHGTHA